MSNFEPQCKTKADLHREWARVLDMCEGTGINPARCCKYNNIQMNAEPSFDESPFYYEFAIAVVEGKPVFRGDKLWCGISNHQFTVKGLCNNNRAFEYATVYDGRVCVGIDSCSWIPTKAKIFSLIDMPFPNGWNTMRYANHLDIHFEFNNPQECHTAAIKIIEAMGLINEQ